MDMEEKGLLDMNVEAHRVCLFLVYHKRIQEALDNTRDAWNHHKVRTERNRTPVAMWSLSRAEAQLRGYWTGDPGDNVGDIDDMYGVDEQAPPPPSEEARSDPSTRGTQPTPGDTTAERNAGVVLNGDDELERARELLDGFDFDQDDGNWGRNVYSAAVSEYMLATR